jgi:hypothetical protein
MRVLTALLLATVATGCNSAPVEIVGTWVDDFGTTHVIDELAWEMTGDGWSSLFHVESVFDDEAFLVARNDSANDYSPDLYSRFDWTTDEDGELWVCQSVFDAETAAAAEGAAAPDATDPATGGCGTFPWSHLVEAE